MAGTLFLLEDYPLLQPFLSPVAAVMMCRFIALGRTPCRLKTQRSPLLCHRVIPTRQRARPV